MFSKIHRKIARSITTSPFKLKAEKAIVSFTFDDFTASAATVGGKLLQNANMNGTYYLCGNYISKELDHTEIASKQMIKDLMSAGHEIGCHTYNHIDCQSSDRKTLFKDLQQNQHLIEKVTGQKPVNFAYPYGNMDLTSKYRVMSNYRTARGIDSGLNYGWIDLANLKANAIYSSSYSTNQMTNLISEAVQKKAWLIFYSHDVCKEPNKFGCTPEQLNEIIDMVEKSGSIVLPIKHALAHYAFATNDLNSHELRE